MNPPFPLGPRLPFRAETSSYRLDPPDPNLSFHRFEVSAGATFAPGQNVEAQTQIGVFLHPRFFLRFGFASDFSERALTTTLQAGTRIPLPGSMSLDFSAIAGIANIFDQNRQQGQLAEITQRTGFTLYVGGEARLNAEIAQNFGVYGALSYMREFCGEMRFTPTILPYSGNAGVCEEENIFGFSAGLRFQFGPTANRNENRPANNEEPIDEPSNIRTPPRSREPEYSPSTELDPVSLREIVTADIIGYIRDLNLITQENVYSSIEEVAQHSRFARLPGEFQKLVILSALRGTSIENLKILSNELFIIHQGMQRARTFDAIETGVQQACQASGIPLEARTLQHLRNLRQSDRANNRSYSSSYLNATGNLSTACLHYTLAPISQGHVRRYILEVAGEANIQSGNLESFRPPVISYSEASVSAVCHVREALSGCATTGLPLHQQSTYISLSSSSPLGAYETIIHENMHLFSALSRRRHGCNDSNSYSLRGQNLSFPYWMEEALNQYNTHLLLSSVNLYEAFHYEPNSEGRQAIESTVTHLGEALNLHWRSMHLFCRGDEVRNTVGTRLFQRLISGYDAHDYRGAVALQRVNRYFTENPTQNNSSDD